MSSRNCVELITPSSSECSIETVESQYAARWNPLKKGKKKPTRFGEVFLNPIRDKF